LDYPANKKKGQEPSPVPALSEVSKLVEHAAVDRVDHPRCEMCWQDVVVTLVEGKVPEFVILNNVLIEEAVQRSLLGCFQSLEIAPGRKCAMHRTSHNNPPDFCRETTGGARDGLVHPGSGIARMGDRNGGGGGNDFVRCRMQSGGGQNGGALPSLRREAQGHHAERTVSKDPPPPPNIEHLLRANCLSYTPMTRA
jgi:hypothetical protein